MITKFYDKMKKNSMFIIEIIVFLVIIIPYLYVSFYSFPTVDDFAGACNARNASYGSSLLVGSLNMVKRIYFSWQGSYSGLFIDYYLSPILRAGFLGVHLESLFLVLGFFFLSFIIICDLLRYFQVKYNKVIYVFIYEMFIGFLLLFQDVDEYFYWHTGASVYTFPVFFALMALILEFSYLRNNKRWKIVTASVCAFIASGGTLQISAYVCVFLLGMVLLEFNENKHISKSLTIVFVAALVGALINVAAPGNYVRHGKFSEEYFVFDAIARSCKSVAVAIYAKLQNGILIGSLIIVFVLGLKYLKNSKYAFRNPGLISLFLLVGNIVITFPVKFGYGMEDFPSRCVFTQNIALSLSLFLITLYWAGWLIKKVNFHFSPDTVLCIIIMTLLAFSPLLQRDIISQAIPVRIYSLWRTGEIEDFYEKNKAILDVIEQTEGDEVYIPQDMFPAPIGIVKPLELSTDGTDWVNDAVAGYYNKLKVEVYLNE